MRIYAARHGQTQWNAENRICGRTDLPLTQTGMAQAVQLAENAVGKGIDLIIASPMLRTRQTAGVVAEKLGVPVQTDDRLIEQDYGIYEGMDRKTQAFLDNKRQFATRHPGGESAMQLAYRVYSLLEEVRAKYPDRTVLLVCHGGIMRVIRTYFEDMTNEAYANYSAENAELAEYEF